MIQVMFNTCITNITLTIKDFHNKIDLTVTHTLVSHWLGSGYTPLLELRTLRYIPYMTDSVTQNNGRYYGFLHMCIFDGKHNYKHQNKKKGLI
jgi:hypothetical protein